VGIQADADHSGGMATVYCMLRLWLGPERVKLRRFREVYTEIPRKNGKSAISAGVALYCFTCDNEFGAEVYSGATTEKQAWEVFRPARLMCKRTPLLVEAFGIEVNASNLNRPEDGARFEPLIGNPGDGASPHCAIVDEYHEHHRFALHHYADGYGGAATTTNVGDHDGRLQH
jgi:phage terminase large subunit-like protein